MVDLHVFIGKIIEILRDFGRNHESAKVVILDNEAHQDLFQKDQNYDRYSVSVSDRCSVIVSVIFNVNILKCYNGHQPNGFHSINYLLVNFMILDEIFVK